jgi:hypothetical protein
LIATSPAYAAPFAAGDVLVSRNGIDTGDLYEYTRNGVLRQHLSVPYPGTDIFETGEMRDLAFDDIGRLHIYHGTFAPTLSTLDPRTQTWTQHSTNGWSTLNITYYGGLSTYRNFVYATDDSTFGGEPSGIVRFDRSHNYSAQRFRDGTDFIDVNTGLDGILYATSDLHTVEAFDPLSLALLRTIALPVDVSAIAVASDGKIFAPGIFGDTKIYRFDASGNIEAFIDTAATDLQDIDLSPTGQLVVGSRFGTVYLSDASLSAFTSFQTATSDPIFVAFVPVPEPGTAAFMALGLVVLVCIVRSLGCPRSPSMTSL